MAIYKIRDEVLLDIANAIREKLYTDKQYYPIQFADLIRSIETIPFKKFFLIDANADTFLLTKPTNPQEFIIDVNAETQAIVYLSTDKESTSLTTADFSFSCSAELVKE